MVRRQAAKRDAEVVTVASAATGAMANVDAVIATVANAVLMPKVTMPRRMTPKAKTPFKIG
jgi:hypothetical protein